MAISRISRVRTTEAGAGSGCFHVETDSSEDTRPNLASQPIGRTSHLQGPADREMIERTYAHMRSIYHLKATHTDSSGDETWLRVAVDEVEREDLVAKTWFITGASKGFGREWTEAALERGDKVAATARNPETLEALVNTYGDAVLPIQLDVTDRVADFQAVKKAANYLGKLDVVVNNAGYGHFGAIEELSEEDVRSQLETNLFGALWVTQAALPIMRAQRSGHIIQVSSIGGITAFPTVGAYHASKWALEGFSQALSQEVADFGIKVTLIEPGGYSTDWAGPSSKHSDENPAYSGVRDARNRSRASTPPGDPKATRAAILKVVDADEPPLRIFFGKVPLGVATADYESRLATWNQWQPISIEAHGSE